MRWRESYERPEPIMTTGESCERVEVDARYELITPLGLMAVAKVMGSATFRAEKDLWNLDSEGIVGRALCDAYGFLGGNGVFHLARACALILEALALQDGAERVMPGHVEGSPGYECLPPAGMRALARAAAGLAGTIGPYTRERIRFPVSTLVGGAIEGMFAWYERDEEDEGTGLLGRAALDLMDAIHMVEKWPELQAATLRGPGCEPPPKPSGKEMILGDWVIDGKMDVKWIPSRNKTGA